jgi:predicted negative regulator of RcsB-dependent stress response
MATQLDLREQEQIDDLKAFWARWGGVITWVLTLVLAGFAAYNGWQWWQGTQGEKASGMYDELDRAAKAADLERTVRMFNDLKERHPKTLVTAQGALMAAKLQADKGKTDEALATLQWAADNSSDSSLKVVARLRLAALLVDKEELDKAIAQLDGIDPSQASDFAALIADRRGDILQAQGKKPEAVAAYQAAHKAMGEKQDYRRLIDAKLTALGAAPAAAAASAAASGAAQ